MNESRPFAIVNMNQALAPLMYAVLGFFTKQPLTRKENIISPRLAIEHLHIDCVKANQVTDYSKF